jgi:Flp pilus assembly pilin Flp
VAEADHTLAQLLPFARGERDELPNSPRRGMRRNALSSGVPPLIEGPNEPDAQGWGIRFSTLFQEGFKMLKSFIRDERGEDLIEYGLLAAFVAAIALAVIIADPLGLTTAVTDAYQRATDALNAQ